MKICHFLSTLQLVSQMQQNAEKENGYVKMKGLSWLLSSQSTPHEAASTPSARIERVGRQSKKWKKHVANRFDSYNKTVEKFIQSQFKRQTDKQGSFQYDSLRKTQTCFNYLNKRSFATEQEQDKSREYSSTIVNLKKKERVIYNEISKIKTLKEMSVICQKKKNFYDSCVDEYFQNYRKDISRTITKLADRSARDSKAKINRC